MHSQQGLLKRADLQFRTSDKHGRPTRTHIHFQIHAHHSAKAQVPEKKTRIPNATQSTR